MKRVNEQIDDFRKDLEYLGPPVDVYDRFFEVTSHVEYAAKEIFSIHAEISANCGAHPTGQNISVTFDLRTAKKVEFAELFKDYKTDKERILETIFARQIARSKRLVAAGRKSGDSANCHEDPGPFSLESLKSEDLHYVYHFSPAGLAVEPEFPEPACVERVTVPYQQLKEFAAPNGILKRVVP